MKTQSIIRKYKRKSRSPFTDDDSTILLLATIEDKKSLKLCFDRYIYLHRDEVGRWLGISLSNQLIAELDDDIGKYRQGQDMLQALMALSEEIGAFVENFSDEIEAVFGINATSWLEAAKSSWQTKLGIFDATGDST